MRRAVLAAALAVIGLAAVPIAASAQSFGFFGNPQPTSAYQSAVKTRGHVVVDFHGDPAAGCADAHVCGVSGTVTWSPGTGGYLIAYGFKAHGTRMEGGYLSVGDELGYGGSPGTSARVRRSGEGGEGLCADVGPSEASSDSADRPGTSVELSLLGDSEVLRTRCAGPLTDDVRSLLPSRSIDERAVRRGGAKLDFSADGEFAAHGLAGTLHSNVVLSVKKGTDLLAEQSHDATPPGEHTVRDRYLQVTYRVESVSGQVVTNVHGLSDPDLCGPLDSCGLLGTITTLPSATKGDGVVYAYASAKHSRHELRQAVGLASGRPPRGIRRTAAFEWDDKGTVTSDLARNGAPACKDTVGPAGDAVLDLRFARDHVTGRYYGGFSDPLRTRCPGPGSGDAGSGLARGTFPLRQLGQRHTTLRITRGTSFSSNGYRGATKASLAVAIRRVRIREWVETDPAFK
jgi:hypothetical protein